MYHSRSGLLIGFHGCDKKRQLELLYKPDDIPISIEPFDWLGHGMYFWENNFDRAFEWANMKQKKGRIVEPSVLGAVIDLGRCCDLQDSSYISLIQTYFKLMEREYKILGKTLPKNENSKDDENKGNLIRFLDCATFEFMHQKMKERSDQDIHEKGFTEIAPFDSVRGTFIEGGEAYAGSGFASKTHTQICIRNSNCIKGFFLKRNEIYFP